VKQRKDSEHVNEKLLQIFWERGKQRGGGQQGQQGQHEESTRTKIIEKYSVMLCTSCNTDLAS
jgi:hypothetical protein